MGDDGHKRKVAEGSRVGHSPVHDCPQRKVRGDCLCLGNRRLRRQCQSVCCNPESAFVAQHGNEMPQGSGEGLEWMEMDRRGSERGYRAWIHRYPYRQ